MYAMWTKGQSLIVLQDLYHARERISRELRQGHPLLFIARREINQLITNLIDNQYSTVDEFTLAMRKYHDKYTAVVTYAACGDMATIAELGREYAPDSLILTGQQIVELYNRNTEQYKIDDSSNVQLSVLRPAGATALHNIIQPCNVKYVYDRTRSECKNTRGTTQNEALHRIYNGRLTSFGGLRTFVSAQQVITIIQYHYNYQLDTGCKDQYWCDILPLPINTTRQVYQSPLPDTADDILGQLQVQFTSQNVEWSDVELNALKGKINLLATGQEYCHTKNVHQWMSGDPSLSNKTTAQIKRKINQLHRELQNNNTTTQ